jgi:hypothetical protein
MRVVSQFENDLLRILQGVVSRAPIDQFRSQLVRKQLRPKCLGRDAVELIEQSLAAGLVMRMTRSGAWQSDRHLRAGRLVQGNLWQRTPPHELGLSFSAASIDLLVDLTVTQNCDSMPSRVANSNQAAIDCTLGDRVLQYCIAHATAELPLLSEWYRQEPLISNELIALAMPDRYAAAEAFAVLDFEAWMTGTKAIMLEALQPEFGESMLRLGHLKSQLADPGQVEQLGIHEDRVFNAYLTAARKQRRPDLCQFILVAGNQLLSNTTSVRQWFPCLDVSKLNVSQRAATYRSGASLPRAICQIGDWHRESRSIGYFDEGYVESQWLKSCWEQVGGNQLRQQAERVLKELDVQA